MDARWNRRRIVDALYTDWYTTYGADRSHHEETHALLRQLADADELSLHEELALAVKARKKERFVAEFNAGYAAMSAEERAEEAAEMAVWDSALPDGLEGE
jgi:hypothetical protein